MKKSGKCARAWRLIRREPERGSISILTIGLFVITVSLLILLTDVASIAVAKRSLVHATESAAIRATHNLDLAAYYHGDAGVDIPIDCQMAYGQVIDELDQWMLGDTEIRRVEIEEIKLVNFGCTGNYVQLTTSARTHLPFRLPKSSLAYVEIHATVTAESDRKG